MKAPSSKVCCLTKTNSDTSRHKEKKNTSPEVRDVWSDAAHVFYGYIVPLWAFPKRYRCAGDGVCMENVDERTAKRLSAVHRAMRWLKMCARFSAELSGEQIDGHRLFPDAAESHSPPTTTEISLRSYLTSWKTFFSEPALIKKTHSFRLQHI